MELNQAGEAKVEEMVSYTRPFGELRIRTIETEGFRYVDLRCFDRMLCDSDEPTFSMCGIALRPEELPAAIEALQRAARDFGIG